MPTSIDILRALVSFPTVSRTSNLELIVYVEELLTGQGIHCVRVSSEDGRCANLYAKVGPTERPGVMLSGHTDVVPVEGQPWNVQPFELTETTDRLYGRGTADMKGFVACALHAMIRASEMELEVPLQLALSYDEEIGCVGVRRLLEVLEASPSRAAFCIVGEPTGLVVATGHKGKTALRATCTGHEAHSALAPSGLNAIHLATDFINILRDHQSTLVHSGSSDGDYDVPYSTIHVGLITGGVALNIVPRSCQIDFEIRNLADDDPFDIIRSIEHDAEEIVKPHRARFAQAAIDIEVVNAYPGLDTPIETEIVGFVKSLTGGNSTSKVAFGTEAGLFNERLGLPAVVCGPGSMDQGHKPDEYVTREQLRRCDSMMDTLLERLCAK